VSVSRAGASEWDRGSRDPSISDDGRYIAFWSGQDFVASDTNGDQDLYLFDNQMKTWTRADLSGDGTSSIGNEAWDFEISGDGKYVVFESREDFHPNDGNGTRRDIFIWDVASDETTIVTPPRAGGSETNRGSRDPSISDDGRYVSFFTGQDLVASDTNDEQDLYVKDMLTGTYMRADLTGDGVTSPNDDLWNFQMSGNGRYVVFETDEVLKDTDANGSRRDVYMWDRITDEVTHITAPRDGATEWDRGSRDPTISDDGRYVAFYSGQDLVVGDTNDRQDFYLYDASADRRYVLDLTRSPGLQTGDNDTEDLMISGDGMWLSFESDSPNFVSGDTNSEDDVFVAQLSPILTDGAARLAGATRYETCVEISKEVFPNGADTVVIATGENWPDALGGSALAGTVGGPMLLTRSDSLPAAVKAEITRLGAKNAYILGGTDAVSTKVENQLDSLLSGFINRIDGDDRYETSEGIADKVIALSQIWDGTVLVVTGAEFADALSGAPLAAGLEWPVLLANPDTGDVYMPDDMQTAVILGGSAAVPMSTQYKLAISPQLANEDITRLAGANRYGTSAKVAQYGVDSGLLWDGVGVASGMMFPDGLTGGAALGMQRTVLLLTPQSSLASEAEAKLTANKASIETARFLGGTAAVSGAVMTKVKTILGL
jgi:putative cell wall-binding protein/Tol biopolymer transport system component